MKRWAIALVIAACPATAWAGVTADEVLSNPRYEFCNDESYPLTVEEAEAWCSLVPDPNPRCPALPAACRGPRAKVSGEGPMARRTADKTETKEADTVRRRDSSGPSRRHDVPEQDRALPEMGIFAHLVLWGVVLAMVLILAAQLRGGGPRLPTSTGPDDDAPPPDEPAPDGPDVLGNDLTDVGRLIARAHERAGRGDHAGAVADSRAALLRHHAEQGRLELQATRTNGDYVRELAAHPEQQSAARTVLRMVERVQFGATGSTAQVVSEVLRAVRQIVGPAMLILMTIVASLACSSDTTRSYPWATSPSGRRAVLETMRGNDLKAEFRSEPLADLDRSTTPIVLADADLERDEWDALLRMVRAGGSAVVATRSSLPMDLDVSSAARTGNEVRVSNIYDALKDRTVVIPGTAGMTSAWGAAFEPLLVDERGIAYAGIVELDSGSILVLADDALFTNMALAVPDNAEALVEMLEVMGTKFELIDGAIRRVHADAEEATPFAAIDRANLTAAILHLLVFILALYLWRGIHFGRPKPPPPSGRRRYVEHIEALARHYHRAGARRHALRHYATWALERLQETFGRRSAGLHRLAHRIARRTGRDETEVVRTLVEAWDARDDRHDDTGAPEDLACLRELGRLTETTRGKR